MGAHAVRVLKQSTVIVILTVSFGTTRLCGQAHTPQFHLLYSFTDRFSSCCPISGLTLDNAGNLYGVSSEGAFGVGTVFTLTRNEGGTWSETVLHTFTLGSDGGDPVGNPVFDQSGSLYTTAQLGGLNGSGTLLRLTKNPDGSWTSTVAFNFPGGTGGAQPNGVVFDSSGNLYGTTQLGGNLTCSGRGGCGVVFRLSPNSDGTWTETVLHSFNGRDGSLPIGSLSLDSSGNMYGITLVGGSHHLGTVFKVTSSGNGRWSETVLLSFTGSNGSNPEGGVALDTLGDLYGITPFGGKYSNGVAYRLTSNGNGTYTDEVLHSFSGFKDGSQPYGGVVIDSQGNLYGTTSLGGNVRCASPNGCGVVFKLDAKAKGSSAETVLHYFGSADGSAPYAGVTLDAKGNLFGVTSSGGDVGLGAVFQISPPTATSILGAADVAPTIRSQVPFTGLSVRTSGSSGGRYRSSAGTLQAVRSGL